MAKYVKNDAIVIWALTEGDTTDPVVTLKGWNYAEEIKLKGIQVKTICDNIWLQNDKDMRSITDLVKAIKPL